MPTRDPRYGVSRDQAVIRAGLRAFPDPVSGGRVGGVGLEPEYFPILVGPRGEPRGRMPLRARDGESVLDVICEIARREPDIGAHGDGSLGPWEYHLGQSGRLTFEPGGQVEHSTAVYACPSTAVTDVSRVLALLGEGFADHGAVLAAVGLDLWHDVATVAQQLPFGRYEAQAAYYERRGTWGQIMMRHTASLQINLDLGPEGVWQERWLAANLLSPLITASFACSPSQTAASARARVWQQMDPTRSGFPERLIAGAGDDPRAEWATAAMAADVMLFRLPGNRWEPGTPGFTFERWLSEGHPEHGWPTVEDLDYHLTTLFFEVRPRGFLELRAGEAVPDRLRAAQVVLVTSALYDDRARAKVIEVLGGHRPMLTELWRRAAAAGLGDDELCGMAGEVWEEAVRGAERLGTCCVGPDDLDAARSFLEEYVAACRTPADTLRALHAESPARSLAWAAARSLPR